MRSGLNGNACAHRDEDAEKKIWENVIVGEERRKRKRTRKKTKRKL